VETDAPFLTPVPFRGETNMPARVAVTAAAVAALRGVSADDVRSATTSVAERLFDFSASQRGGA
jgi:TatD DNase family protein